MGAAADRQHGDEARAPASEEVHRAFAALGLDPSAGPDLVDLAYWHLVDEARATLHGTPAWRTRLTELNAARTCLSDHFALWRRARGLASPEIGGAPLTEHAAGSSRGRVLLSLLAALPASAALALITVPEHPERLPAAGAPLLLAVAVAAFMSRRGDRARPAMDDDAAPARLLHLHPHAPPSLAALVYEHLRRGAVSREDPEALAALARAYADVRRAARQARAAAPADGNPAGDDGQAAVVPAAPAGEREGRAWRWHRLRLTRRLPLRARWRQARGGQAVTAAAAPAASATVPPPAAEPVVRAVGTLRVLRGVEEVLAVPLADGGVYTIGTAPHCRVALPGSAEVAAEHARITVRRGRVRFHHLTETGRSLINGQPSTWVVLEPGDEIRIGPYVCRYLAAHEHEMEPAARPALQESAPAVHTARVPSPPTGSP